MIDIFTEYFEQVVRILYDNWYSDVFQLCAVDSQLYMNLKMGLRIQGPQKQISTLISSRVLTLCQPHILIHK